MGVQNLWVLLAPVGRQIELESLAGQVLAVDASIWLTQFVKAMRDDEGNMIRNAHLLGTFHRVAKLLYYGVRPVFVFDGQTPEIKKRTTARRRKRQETQVANLRHTAQRLLLNRLKLQRQELKKNGGAPPSATAPGFVLPEAPTSSNTEPEQPQMVSNDVEREGAGVSADAEASTFTGAAEVEEKEDTTIAGGWNGSVDEEDEASDLTVDDIALDTSRLSKIDLHAVFSLPPHLQKDMIQKILRDRRQEVRDQFIPLAGNPEAYSHTQISAFLATSALNKRIEAAKRQKKDEEVQGQAGGPEDMGPGRRIDSNSNRFFIYQKGCDEESKEEVESEDVVAEVERSDSAERAALTDALWSEKRSGRQRTQDKVDGDLEKRPLSTFSTGGEGLVPDASATTVTAPWIVRQKVRAKQEPMLAIEKLRLEKLKREQPVTLATQVSDVQHPVHDVSISLSLDDSTLQEVEKFKKELLSASAREPDKVAEVTSVGEDEDEDDMEWEDVAPAVVPTMAKAPDSLPKRLQGTASAMQLPDAKALEPKEQQKNEKAEEDDDMQWEDVPVEPKLDRAVTSSLPAATSSDSMQVQERSALISGSPQEEEKAEEDENEDTEELFLTLKNEMEDAKAHEDLNLLKDEALQSAMATASNLTQWAAGAVRRALEAHSQQHGRAGLSSTAASSSIQGSSKHGITAEQPIELSDDEDKAEPPSSVQQADVVVMSDEDEHYEIGETRNAVKADAEGENSDDERLQAALTASLADEMDVSKEQTSGGRVRYLQYTTPVEPSTLLTPDVREGEEQIEDAATLEREQRELKRLRGRQLRDTEGITDEMVEEVMALLRLFGVPFLVSPMEAEAQCAALEQLGLVDGVITDDSDIFPFGGQRVYKNIFHHQRFVEAFSARDVERELGFSREQLIALALLLGSDYTDGVRGIGIVNAAEVAAAYPGIDGLKEFKSWVRDFNVVEEAQRVSSNGTKRKKVDGSDEEDETARERFQRSHASVRRRWELGDEFPSKRVVDAYMAPQVDRSDARFSWSAPDLAALRNYCTNAFGWDQRKSDGVLLPLTEKVKAAAAAGSSTGRRVQTRLDGFFRSYDDQVRYAQIRSKRLRSAVTSSKDKSKAKKKRK